MSVARLLLSGLLVASGLILGAFTLHGYFDPQWLERQAAAAGQRLPASEAKWVTSVQDRSRVMSVVAKGTEGSKPAKTPPKAETSAEAKPDAKPPSQADADALCAAQFGSGWRLAEFHDPVREGSGENGEPPRHGGWNFYAAGALDTSTRYWVANNDQAANCWDKKPAPTPPPQQQIAR